MAQKKVVNKKLKKMLIKKPTDLMPVFNPGLPVNPTVPTVFADTVESIFRTDALIQLRYFSKAPGANIEAARIMLTTNTMEALIDNYCKAFNYEPKN